MLLENSAEKKVIVLIAIGLHHLLPSLDPSLCAPCPLTMAAPSSAPLSSILVVCFLYT